MTINFKSTITFASQNGNKLLFSPTENEIGDYSIQIKLTDDNKNPLTSTYSINVNVLKNQTNNNNNQYGNDLEN